MTRMNARGESLRASFFHMMHDRRLRCDQVWLLPVFRRHFRFEVNVESVGDTVDIVKVRDDLGRVVNGTIVEAGLAERGNIRLVHRPRRSRQLQRVVTQRPVGG